ncbi:MAG: RloB family protein [Burkholderiales bacterium]|jgi:hypothetical protein|nr:RloB family protein [Burkholderiales bacterium]
MGRDGQPKERQRRQLERKLNQRASYDRILIVTEGEKTEPYYFREICKTHRLQTTNVMVKPCEFGTAPIQVVQFAKTLLESGDQHKRIQPRAFEQVFAVFDRDDHKSFFDALNLAESLDGKLKNDVKQPVSFRAITSVPCFELWLLLHYQNVQALRNRDDVYSRLRQYIPGYTKSADNIFTTTCGHLDTAIQRAEKLAGQSDARTDSEPFTNVFELVNQLITMRSPKG